MKQRRSSFAVATKSQPVNSDTELCCIRCLTVCTGLVVELFKIHAYTSRCCVTVFYYFKIPRLLQSYVVVQRRLRSYLWFTAFVFTCLLTSQAHRFTNE